MTDRQWASVWKLYSELRDLTEAERRTMLAGSDLPPEVLQEVEALLEQATVVSQSAGSLPSLATDPGYDPGTEFGRYVITGIAGQGGFGRVYAAHDKDLRRSVAIKILSRRDKRLLDEARAASALNHPNILTVHETIEINGYSAMVMEFVNGRSLRNELAATHAPLPLETVIRYGAQIAQALDTAHAAGIVHRDVKPENVLVRPDGYLKLVDFGLAAPASVEDPDRWQPFHGTLRYTSPEQLRGGTFTAASDIFSFGLVLYEMAAGIHPFRKETPMATADAIAKLSAEPPSRQNSAIPEHIDRLILSMLSKVPSQRPSAKQVAEALSRRPEPGQTKSKRARIATTGGLGLLAIVGILAIWSNRSAAPKELRLKTTPLTGNPGRERRPAISSDGRFVVFEWQESLEEPEKTIVREIGTDQSTVLPVKGPFAWVPGTDRIGYRKKTPGGTSLFTISRLGGPEEEVFTLSNLGEMAWSPDGKQIAYISFLGSNDSKLFVYDIASKQHRQLKTPPQPTIVNLAISPDGRQIAVRSGATDSGIWVSSYPEPEQWRQVLAAETEGEAMTWLRDGSALITSGFRGSNNSLWLHPLAAQGASTRLTSVGVEAFQVQAAIDRNRLVWLHSVDDSNIWKMPAAGGVAVRVVASLFRDSDVAVASSGNLAFRSDRSGYPEIWVAGPTGEGQKRVSGIEGFTGSPRWSADGRKLLFDSRPTGGTPDIWMAECGTSLQCEKPFRITGHPEADALPNWSRDGRHFYFASRRSGSWQLWKASVPSDKTAPLPQPVQLTTDGGYFGTESATGDWLYYSRLEPPEVAGIWRIPMQGAKIPFEHPGEKVLALATSSTATWNVCGDEVFYQTFFHRSLGPLARTEIHAFNLKTKQDRDVKPDGVAKISRGLSVSADCKSVYFSRLDRSESNIVWADYEVVK
jgi:eukaryotic-like serine/threonine-protein kinase